MLPFLQEATKNDIPILVMNPNLNRVDGNIIPYSHSMVDHAAWVWEKYVKNAGFDKIDVVAHSAGGGCLKKIMVENYDTFWKQVSKIAYTDSFVVDKGSLQTEE